MKKKYQLPDFLQGMTDQSRYDKWLHQKAASLVKRDKDRGNQTARSEEYKIATHEAVYASEGRDAYTGEMLDWALLGEYNNTDSVKYGRDYKKRFALLPSVDHVGDGKNAGDLEICSWRTNDAKHDLTYEEFLEVCNKVSDFSRIPVHFGALTFVNLIFGVIFMLLGLIGAFAPHAVAEYYGLALTDANSVTLIRAISGGFSCSLGYLFIHFSLLRTYQLPMLFSAIVILGSFALFRAIGFAFDGYEQPLMLAELAFELIAVVLLIWFYRSNTRKYDVPDSDDY